MKKVNKLSLNTLWITGFLVINVFVFMFLREHFCPRSQELGAMLFILASAFLLWLWAGYNGGTIRRRASMVLFGTLLLFSVWAVPWSPRQKFFKVVGTLHSGMAVQEVESHLSEYRLILSENFDGLDGKSVRSLPQNFTDTVVCVRDSSDSLYNKDKALLTFENGRLSSVYEYADD